jgi:hypothetical protein
MKTKLLVRLSVIFSLVAVVSAGIAIACGGWDDFGHAYSDFAPEPHVDESYTPLLYTSGEMFYQIGYNTDHNTRFNNDILSDWKKYLNSGLTDEFLSFFLLDEKSDEVIDQLYDALFANNKNQAYAEWSQKVNFSKAEIKNFVEFLYFAKQVEKSTVNYFDPWNYDNASKTIPADPFVIKILKSRYQEKTDAFLKNRYWFQVMKACFYSENRQDAITFFEQTQQMVPKNALYYRALAYVAGIERKSGNVAKANYLYSIVFENFPRMRTEAVYSFRPQTENDWNKSLAYAKNSDEKVALWAMLGYYADEGRAISQIYDLNPQSPHLDYLLTRLINKAEQEIYYLEMGNISDYKSAVKAKIDRQKLLLVSSVANQGNTARPYLWEMAAGYLMILDNQFESARSFFNRAEGHLPEGQQYSDQLRLLRLVNMLSETSEINNTAEDKLAPELEWLYFKLPLSADSKFRFGKSISWSKKLLSNLYKEGNNKVMAQLFSPSGEFYFDNFNVEAMKSFLERNNKTAIEKLAAGIYPIIIDDIYEFQAVIATFENRLDDAFNYIQKAGERKDKLLLANPFNGFIKDCHDCEHAAPQKTRYSKFRTIEIMKMMQAKIAKGEDLFNNCLLMANAFYNISYFGNARLFYQGNIIGKGETTYWDIADRYDKRINSMANAKFYYQKALQAAKTDEQKAKCCYMLAKCQRNDYYTGAYVSKTNPGADFLAWDGFTRIKNQYSHTLYYKEVIAECEYFAKYIQGH